MVCLEEPRVDLSFGMDLSFGSNGDVPAASIFVPPSGLEALNKTSQGTFVHSTPPDGSEQYGALMEMYH